MGEIAERYVEQLSTTIETMRRRAISYYDGIFYFAKRLEKAAERVKDIAEPVTYDARDYTNQAISDVEPLTSIDTETKNSLVEMYLGISVILIGFAGGELSGAYALSPLINYFFDTYVIFLIMLALPTYVFYNIRKNISLDDTERRSTLFSSTMVIGIFLGYLMGPRILSLAPTVLFATPFIFALLFDNGIVATPLSGLNRHSFFISFASFSVFLSTLLASIVLGYFSIAVSLLSIVHAIGLFVHFQLVHQFIKDKNFATGESQLAYIGAVVFSQVLLTILFGYNKENQKV